MIGLNAPDRESGEYRNVNECSDDNGDNPNDYDDDDDEEEEEYDDDHDVSDNSGNDKDKDDYTDEIHTDNNMQIGKFITQEVLWKMVFLASKRQKNPWKNQFKLY